MQTVLVAGDLDMDHARALFTIGDATQITLANQIVSKRLSVREAEKLVASILKPPELKSLKQKGGYQGDRDVAHFGEELADQLGLGVQIRLVVKGCGQLAVQFSSLGEFDGLLAHPRLDAGEEAT